jgi:hypothetical protein
MSKILRTLIMHKPKTAIILGSAFLLYTGTKPALEYYRARQESDVAERRVAIEEKRVELEQLRLAEERAKK